MHTFAVCVTINPAAWCEHEEQPTCTHAHSQYLLQFPQELDGPCSRDVGPVEEREAAAVHGERIVRERVIWGEEWIGTFKLPFRRISYISFESLFLGANFQTVFTRQPWCLRIVCFSVFVCVWRLSGSLKSNLPAEATNKRALNNGGDNSLEVCALK